MLVLIPVFGSSRDPGDEKGTSMKFSFAIKTIKACGSKFDFDFTFSLSAAWILSIFTIFGLH